MLTCTKIYLDIPFAHRQPNHTGHCQLIHGHNWSLEIEFSAEKLDKCGFVVDFGDLGYLKNYLAHLDHALVLNESDPFVGTDLYLECLALGLFKPVLVPDCSSEGLAVLFQKEMDALVGVNTEGRVRVTRVKVMEDHKNSVEYSC